jgi:hypothetical protein
MQSSHSNSGVIGGMMPEIVRDIEGMEREFTRFLEVIYN